MFAFNVVGEPSLPFANMNCPALVDHKRKVKKFFQP